MTAGSWIFEESEDLYAAAQAITARLRGNENGYDITEPKPNPTDETRVCDIRQNGDLTPIAHLRIIVPPEKGGSGFLVFESTHKSAPLLERIVSEAIGNAGKKLPSMAVGAA